MNIIARESLARWKEDCQRDIVAIDKDFVHSVSFLSPQAKEDLKHFAVKVAIELEPLVAENNLAGNLPKLEPYNGIGQLTETIVHHPSYEQAGNIIYGSKLLERMSKPGGLAEALAFMFVSSQMGEAGHNCPLACSAGIIRVLQKTTTVPNRQAYIQKLIDPSYSTNFTGAQFLTEVQGGSDVGLNAVEANQENGIWRIKGEKWFCSNADAELILVTARYNPAVSGTKGLGLFLVPSHLENGERNNYRLRRLKDKIGTRSMASSEIDFLGAEAFAVGAPEQGFKLVMENVLHISRLFNTACVVSMARRAMTIAFLYAQHRVAFGQPIINYPLIRENLAIIRAENTALMASLFAAARLQDAFDTGISTAEETKLLLRLLANLNKYLSAKWSVDHIHHSLDVLAGNGAIETFSSLPRLLRDSVVCENWEGTHNTLRMQILKDIEKYRIDEILREHISALLKGKTPSEGLKKLLLNYDDSMASFKKLSKEDQTLFIRGLVDQMAILYAGVSLFLEGGSKEDLMGLYALVHSGEPLFGNSWYGQLINFSIDKNPF